MRNQERRRAKKKACDHRQRARASTGPQAGFDNPPPYADPLGFAPPGQPTAADTVQALLMNLIHTHDGVAGQAIERCANHLITLSSGPATWPTWSRAVVNSAERIIATCWANGWQPADLARVVGRELTARHLRLAADMIAAQGRRYAASSLEPRWSAQLQELAASVWWDNDGSYLDALGTRERLDRQATATVMLELLRLLGRLPQIAPVGPQPGSYRSTTPPRSGTQAAPNRRMLDRIRALLAKAESTEFPEEAEALSTKAQQLMAHHSISAALLDADAGRTEGPATRRIGVDNPYEGPKALLLEAVAAANRCRSIWMGQLGCSTLVGHDPDLDAVELLYTSLLVQATTAMTRAGSRQDREGRSRTRAFRQSFLVAYAGRIGQRLRAATKAATSAAAAGLWPDGSADADGAVDAAGGTTRRSDPRLLPVLAARSDAVDDATERLFPHAVTHALSSRDREGWAHGTAAADRAVLHGHAEVAGGSP